MQRLPRTIPLLAAAFILSALSTACSVPPKGGFGDVDRLVSERLGQKAIWNQGTSEDAEADKAVEKLLEQVLTPESAVQIALLRNPSLQATLEDMGVAQADLVQAGLLHNPTVEGTVRFPHGNPSSTEHAFSGAFDVLEVFILPLRKKVAEREFEKVKLRVAHAILSLAAEVKAAYFAAVAGEQESEFLERIASATDATARLSERQHKSGTASALELDSQRAFHERALLDLERARLDVVAARERLARLMGLPDTNWNISRRLPDPPSAMIDRESLLQQVLAHRLDVAAAHQEVEALGKALSLARGTRWIGGLNVGASHEKDPGGQQVTGPSFQLEVPLFDWKQASLARLEALLRQSKQNLLALENEARSEIRGIAARLEIAGRLAKRYREEILPLRERVLNESVLYYNGMLIGVYQLLQAKQDQILAMREYVEILRGYWTAYSELERAAGGKITFQAASTIPSPTVPATEGAPPIDSSVPSGAPSSAPRASHPGHHHH